MNDQKKRVRPTPTREVDWDNKIGANVAMHQEMLSQLKMAKVLEFRALVTLGWLEEDTKYCDGRGSKRWEEENKRMTAELKEVKRTLIENKLGEIKNLL